VKLLVRSLALDVEVVDLVRQHTLETKDGSLLASKGSALVETRGVEQSVAFEVRPEQTAQTTECAHQDLALWLGP
jgi:hypothetical protein